MTLTPQERGARITFVERLVREGFLDRETGDIAIRRVRRAGLSVPRPCDICGRRFTSAGLASHRRRVARCAS
jgi:hypothetical protein